MGIISRAGNAVRTAGCIAAGLAVFAAAVSITPLPTWAPPVIAAGALVVAVAGAVLVVRTEVSVSWHPDPSAPPAALPSSASSTPALPARPGRRTPELGAAPAIPPAPGRVVAGSVLDPEVTR